MSALPIDQQYKLNRHVTTVVSRCWNETPDIRVLELSDPGGWDLPPFSPGAHVDVVMSEELTRQYSLCGDPSDRKHYRIGVLRERGSRGGSVFMHESLYVGDRVSVSLPRNLFPLASNADRHVLVAGGIGLTPFMPMVAQLLREGRMFHLHVCTRDLATLPFSDELQKLRGAGLATFHPGGAARLDMAALLREQPPGSHAYFCGPGPMLEAFIEASAHWADDCVHYERFGAVPPTGKAYSVELLKSAKTIEVAAGEPMSKALQRAGVAIRTSCEAGICGMCKVRYSAGEVEHRDHCLSDEQRLSMLTPCVSESCGTSVVLDL